MVDYYQCIKKVYPGITDAEFSLHQNEDVLTLTWNREDEVPTLESLETHWLSVVKAQALADVKSLRSQGLDKAAISPGILAVYDINYDASVAFLAGKTTTMMKNGMTAEEYLTGFGSKLQMSPVQFAMYIVAENIRVGPSVYDVEKRYLSLTYGGDAAAGIVPVNYLTTVEAVQQAVSDFRVFCGLPAE